MRQPSLVAPPHRPRTGESKEAAMEKTAVILVIDDDPDVRELVTEYLQAQDFEVECAADAVAARAAMQRRRPDLVVLDIGLPGEDGLSVARHVRAQHDIGIIMVSGAGDTLDRIIGLEVGSDDYLGKPFDLRELLARIRSVLRRYRKSGPATLEDPSSLLALGHVRFDIAGRQLLDAQGLEIPLTTSEYDLLKVLVERPRRVLTRDQIMSLTHNRDWVPYDRSIDILITRLRRKVEADPAAPQIIKTVRGAGYMYLPPRS